MADVAKASVKLTNQPSISLPATLTNADESVSVSVQFRVNDDTRECGIYRASDGKQLWGGRILSDGRAVTVTNILMDTDATGEAYIDIITSYDSESHSSDTTLRLMGVSFDGATDADPENPSLTPDPIGSAAMVTIGADTNPAWDGSTYVDEVYGFIRGKGDFTVGAESTLRLAGGNGTTIEGCAFQMGQVVNERDTLELYANFAPLDNGSCNLGGGSNRWRRLYCTLSVDVSSDERLKQDITDASTDLIMHLRPRQYRLKSDPTKLQFGLIAQEVKQALDACGIEDADLYGDENPDSLSLRYEQLISPLIAMAQAQQRRIDALERRLGG